MIIKATAFILISLFFIGCVGNPDKESLAVGAKELIQVESDELSPDQSELSTESNESIVTDEDIKVTLEPIVIQQQWDEISIQEPTNGIILEEEDSITYEPFLDFNDSDFIKIEYIKEGSVVFTRNITVNITAVNDAPIAVNDSASTTAETQITINPLSNDTDVDDADVITIKSIDAATNGVVSLEGNTVTYTSNPQFNGTETLNYTVEDAQGLTDQATITISSTYNNDTPPSNSKTVPVRLTFIEHSDGSKLTEDYLGYATNVIAKLNETYTDNTDQKLNFILDSYVGVENDTYFVTASDSIISALSFFNSNYNVAGKVNIYFVQEIVGGVAGIAYVNQTQTTASMFEKMATPELEKNVVGHEIGHNVGFFHTADQEISEPRNIAYNSNTCNLSTSYYQHNTVTYPPGDANADGWHYGANLMYPIASPDPSSLFTDKYDIVFSDIMNCWHQRSGWPTT